MKKFDGIGRRPGCVKLAIKGVLLGVVFILFRYEIGLVFKLILASPKLLRGQRVDNLPALDVLLPNLLFIVAVGIGVVGMVALMAFLVGRSILPVRSTAEQLDTIRHFLTSLLGGKTVLVRVREGILINPPDEYLHETFKKVRGGSALLVDLNSAVVLEGSAARRSRYGRRKRPAGSGRYPMSRVGRPGLVFTYPGERLRGVVSLRRQFRINLNVLSHTSDGIELRCHVISLFSLGQPPTIFKVAYCGPAEARNLQVLQINPVTRRIVAMTDDLDEADKAEIHAFAQNFTGAFIPLAPLEMTEAGQERPPYFIDDQRIFSAVYSQARQVKEGNMDTWAELPTQIATEIFRSMISTASYNALYGLEQGSSYALLNEFKPSFGRRMRTLGVASYQFIYRQDGACPAVGQRVDNRLFYISEIQDLRTSKVLRDAGIKVITSSFTELNPTDPKIKGQRLDMWRARWQREADIISAESLREIELIRSQARAEKQREIITNLTDITKNTSYSDEALILRLFQTMEELITDSSSHKLLPQDTLRFLQTISLTLLPDSRSRLGTSLAGPDAQLSAGQTQSLEHEATGSASLDYPTEPQDKAG